MLSPRERVCVSGFVDMAGPTQFIVDRLKQAPFNEDVSLVSFDEKSPFELLETLNSVLTHIDQRQERDLREEQPEMTAERMMLFLRGILKYRSNVPDDQFRAGLIQGDRHIIYPIMHWCLEKFADLQKRAYVGRYLQYVEIPEEFFADQDLVEIYEQYKELQNQFKDVHKHVDHLRKSNVSTADMRGSIARMEDEKEQLSHKLNSMKKKFAGDRNFEELLAATSQLRQAQDDEARIQEKTKQQKQQLLESEQKYRQTLQKLKDLKASTFDADTDALLRRLEEETQMNRYLSHEKLPKQLEERQYKLREMEKVLMEPRMNEEDIRDLEQEIIDLERDVRDTKERINNKSATVQDANPQLALYRQTAAMSREKKERVSQKYRQLQAEKEQIISEIGEKESLMQKFKGHKVLKGAEYKQFCEEVRRKGVQVRRMKEELVELRAEAGILNRTESVLRSRVNDVDDFNAQMERKMGIAGAGETEEHLEKVSHLKSNIDEQKADFLEQISAVVKEINDKIKANKAKLNPQIKQLRQARQDFQQLESEYLDKKAVYDNTAVNLESDRAKLESDVSALSDECAREESRYHYFNSMSDIINVGIQRLHDEANQSQQNQSYRDAYDKKVRQQEALQKALRERQKTIKETHEPNLQQLSLFTDLKKLMACKINFYREGGQTLSAFGDQMGGAPPMEQYGRDPYGQEQGGQQGVDFLRIEEN